MVKTYRSIARIVKTHGRKGEVVAVPADGLPPLLEEGLTVAVVPPALKGRRSLAVREASGTGAGQLVSFEGVSDIGAAQKLVGKHLLAAVDDLPDDFARMDLAQIVGREVMDTRLGLIGEVTEVLVGPTQDVYVIEGPFGEVMVPAVDAFIADVPTEGAIVCTLPDSMVKGAGLSSLSDGRAEA